MAKLSTFDPFFSMYLRTPARHTTTRHTSQFASFTERERRYLSPKRMIPLSLRSERVSARQSVVHE
ncbi:MAG: hypothetical protein AB202_02205 [Parcubacteria bacterium C7867-007]|nr:MAG: hypothetical protein AB202_02205 [Parcubacteria bacterium C7867-007]